MHPSLAQLLSDVDIALREGSIGLCGKQVAQIADPAKFAADWVRRLPKAPNRQAACDDARREAKAEDQDGSVFVRWLLLTATRESLALWAARPLPEDILELLIKQLRMPLDDSPVNARLLEPGRGYSLASLCEVIEGKRYPGGQIDWDLSGFPRSQLLATPKRDLPGLLATALFRTGGFSPLAELHLNPRRRNERVLIEKEFLRSYHRVARWLVMRPDVRGVLASSWLWSPDIPKIRPHLAWMRRVPSENGGFFTTLGEELRDVDGASATLRVGCLIWPRKELLRWADKHPEFGPAGSA